MGWLLDPSEKSVRVYRSHQPTTVCDKPEQELPVPDFAQGVQLTVDTIFGWLLE